MEKYGNAFCFKFCVYTRGKKRGHPQKEYRNHLAIAMFSLNVKNDIKKFKNSAACNDSPHLSPIEHQQDAMGRRLYHENKPNPPTDLRTRAATNGRVERVPQTFIQNLLNSVPNRLRLCMQKGGGTHLNNYQIC